MNKFISLPTNNLISKMVRHISFIFLVPFIFQTCVSQEIENTVKSSSPQELTIEVADDIYISGTLSHVNSNSLTIIIAGSGPTDRDCNNNMGLKTDAFKMLASHFESIGISSFRYDKRGIAKSTAVPESTMTMDMYAQDVHTIIDHFKNDYKEIILLGHSEGVLIGSMVAKESEIVSSFIAIAGISTPLDEVVLDQLAKFPKLVPLAEKHIEEIKSGKELSEVNPMLASLFRPSVVPFLKSSFTLNPSEEFSQVRQPILILNGICDIQVPTNHAEKLHKQSSNSELVIIENMGHIIKELKDDCSNVNQAYSDPTLPLNHKVKAALSTFLK